LHGHRQWSTFVLLFHVLFESNNCWNLQEILL
jgi:hypothetical protein